MKKAYHKLRVRIHDKCETLTVFSQRMGIATSRASMMLKEDYVWNLADIDRASEILEISESEKLSFFRP